MYSFSYDLKKVTAKFINRLHQWEDRDVWPASFAVSDQGDYILVGFCDYDATPPRKLIIFGVRSRSLVPLATLDEKLPGFNDIHLAYSKRVGKYILWLRVASKEVLIYCFNCESEELKELVDRRIGHPDYYYFSSKIHRIGEDVYFTGYRAKVMRVRITFE